MNSIKIEKGAILVMKKVILSHDKMNEFFKECDKEPSWDGDICLYTNCDLKSEHIQHRIPTQVKGKNDEKLLKRNGITYPVEYKNLRNYFNDGGVCYFVIAVSDNGEKTAIFYNALTPIKLQSLLKGTENKKPEQTKNISLNRLKRNDKDELYKILLQFGHDSKEQGAGELIRRSISLDDMEKVDSIRVTTFVSDNKEAIQKITSGEACWYGHLSTADIWLPLQYEAQTKMKLVACMRVNDQVGIDGISYYDSFELRKDGDKTFSVRLSENLVIDINKRKFIFEPMTDLEQIIKDIKFLEAMRCGRTWHIGKRKCDYSDVNWGNKFQSMINFYKQLQLATMKFEIKLNKTFENFNDNDWKAMNELVNIYQGKIRPKKENAWHMWWWQDKIVPFFIAIDLNGDVCVENGTHFQHIRVWFGDERKRYLVPSFITFQRDIWEKLYEVDEKVLLEELESGELNNETEGYFSLMLIEILAAYDITKNEKYYNISKVISDKLLVVNPEFDYWKINKFQLLKRKRNLIEDELQELEHMEEKTDDNKVICAANILLDNKRKARNELDKMSNEDREIFMTYPIYNLL